MVLQQLNKRHSTEIQTHLKQLQLMLMMNKVAPLLSQTQKKVVIPILEIKKMVQIRCNKMKMKMKIRMRKTLLMRMRLIYHLMILIQLLMIRLTRIAPLLMKEPRIQRPKILIKVLMRKAMTKERLNQKKMSPKMRLIKIATTQTLIILLQLLLMILIHLQL